MQLKINPNYSTLEKLSNMNVEISTLPCHNDIQFFLLKNNHLQMYTLQ